MLVIDGEEYVMKRPTFYELRFAHGGNLLRIGYASHVHTNIVLAMVLNLGVTEKSANKVISGFNNIHGTKYVLGDIDVVITEGEHFSESSRVPGVICL